ncbi:hypothetical protein PVAND_008381 [Polypedilum vanderplanki]|uniref:TIR domain-containing protein n=1 Tax=Polypedilum vanderplanki TaxID=319348 RepID=A0A9J6CA08_POLVA|nr:hypothetical protein PVAND_008381 [Polypedilum vanderplanki]
MKLFSIILFLLGLINAGFCMSDLEICEAVNNANPTIVHCDLNNDQLMISWKDRHVNIIRSNYQLMQIKCLQSSVPDFQNFPILDMSYVRELEIELGNNVIESHLSDFMHFFNFTGVTSLKLEIKNNFPITSTFLSAFSHIKSLEINAQNKNSFDENALENFGILNNLIVRAYDITMTPVKMFVPLINLSNLMIIYKPLNLKQGDKNFNLSLRENRNLANFTLANVRWPARLNFSFGSVLSNLHIFNNSIVQINAELFGTTEQIESLDLSNNQIKEIPDDFLWKQENLNDLVLSFNEISTINDFVFMYNTELDYLDLSYNKIESCEKNAFSRLEYLRVLKLNNNFLTIIDLPILFHNLNRLQNASLAHNKIYEIHSELPNNTRLENIDFSHNMLTLFYVYKFWAKSTRDLNIELSNNILHGIAFPDQEEDPTDNEKRLIIQLGKTPLNCDCHSISLHNYLHGVNISAAVESFVEIYPEIITCHKNTVWENVNDIIPTTLSCPLDLSPHENLCHPHCSCMKDLHDSILRVKCSKISYVPAMPPKNALERRKVTEIKLNIENNRVTSLPDKNLDNFNSITEIYAKNNLISKLELRHIPDNLMILDLRNNALSYISPEVLTRLESLDIIYLSENRWDCSHAYARNLIKFVNTHEDLIADWNLNKCSNEQFFLSIKETECRFPVSIAIIMCLILFILISAAILCWRNRRNIFEWIYQHDRLHIIERYRDFLKPIDACIVCAEFDTIFANYVGSKLMKAPNDFKKCALIIKDWSANQPIPEKILRGLRNSRRVIVILSEYIDENNWIEKWSYSRIGSRVIFLVKGNYSAEAIVLSNKVMIDFNDSWFWEKLKHAMTKYDEMTIDQNNDVEMQPLKAFL